MEEAKKFFKKVKWDSIITSILTILVGILCVAMPEGSAKVICIIFGISLLIIGATLLVRYFVFDPLFGGSLLIVAMSMIISGIFCLVNLAAVQSILTVLIGLFILVNSISSLADSVYCARARISGWWALLTLSILTAALGVAVMFSNFSTVMIFAGVSLIVDGVTYLITTIVFNHKIKQAKKVLLDKANDIVL